MHVEEGAPPPYSGAWSPWVAYYGGGYPTKPLTRVRIKLRHMSWDRYRRRHAEDYQVRPANQWDWSFNDRDFNIVAFSFHLDDELNG